MVHILIFLFSISLFAQENVERLDTIEVTHQGTSNPLVDFAPSITILDKYELRKRREPTIGDTLRFVPGVHSTFFGPNAGRPIIRGLEGDRIRVLQNGLGVLDASSQSVDHAVPVDTLIIDSVEVVRGPMSMLYGSNAIGGVVNITTNRIHSVFEEGAISEVSIRGDSSQNALGTSAKVDYGVNDWMFHIDTGYRNANDLRIPGEQKSSRADLPGEFEAEDILPNSESVQKSAAVGASKIFSKGYLGMSYYYFDNDYGTVVEEEVDIKMIQNRLELHGEYKIDGSTLKSVRLKTAQSDYGHKELEGGEVGTTFVNEGNETRLEFMTNSEKIKGISGVQTQNFIFKAVGEEAFLPTSRNSSTALFTLQELSQGSNVYSAGARIENSHIDVQSSGGKEKNYNGLNGSLGYRYHFTPKFQFESTLSYTERLPNAQEFFAFGPHLATGIFEQGEEDLNKEKAFAVDLGINYTDQVDLFAFNLFVQRFNDYIALVNSGLTDLDSGFEIYEYSQVDAIFYGFEINGKQNLSDTPFYLIWRGDYVRAKNSDTEEDLPRIAPPRALLGFEWVKDRIIADLEAQYNFAQYQTAPNEEPTDDFTLVNAGLAYNLIKSSMSYSFFGRVRNILNQEARLHTSTIKEIAPLAGRHVVVGLQVTY